MNAPRIVAMEKPEDIPSAAVHIAHHPLHAPHTDRLSPALRWLGRLVPRFARLAPAPTVTEVPPGLRWVDGFVADIRPYVAVRLEDHLLIRMPNQAYKLNATGARMLQFLLHGGTIATLLQRIAPGESAKRELGLFLHEVRRCLAGELREDNASCAVEITPLQVSFSALPVLSEIALTDKCNLRCVFCYAGCAGRPRRTAKPGHQPQPASATPDTEIHPTRLDTAQIKQLLDKIRGQARVPSVSFTGGEPTLRKDLPDLVEYAAGNLGMRVNLITNGTLVSQDLARRLANAGLASAQVSIEAPTAALHERITRIPGSFGPACAAVDYLRAAGVHVHSNTTIHRMNIDAVTAMPRFARDTLRTDRLSMNMVMPAGSAKTTPEHARATLVRYSEIGRVVLAVQQAAIRAGIEFMWYSPTPLCLFNPITTGLGNKGCSACDGLLSVDSSGRVLPCSSFAEPVGDLLRQDFAEIWNDTAAARLRRKERAPGQCPACEHFAFCHGACPLYWQHFGTAELDAASPRLADTRGPREPAHPGSD